MYPPYYEDLNANETIQHQLRRTITEADNTLFCMLTMNHAWMHIDHEYAAQSQHGRPLVVGTLVFSLVVGMSVPDISMRAIANLDYEKIEHLAPVFHGDTLHAESTILDKRVSRTKPDRGIVYLETRAYNQRDELVLRYRRHVMLPLRER